MNETRLVLVMVLNLLVERVGRWLVAGERNSLSLCSSGRRGLNYNLNGCQLEVSYRFVKGRHRRTWKNNEQLHICCSGFIQQQCPRQCHSISLRRREWYTSWNDVSMGTSRRCRCFRKHVARVG